MTAPTFINARDPIIDNLRAVAIIFMVIWHSLMWFSTLHCYPQAACAPPQALFWQIVYYPGSLWSVPLFYFSSGMTLMININRGKTTQIWRRSLSLLLFGYLFTSFIMGANQTLHAWVLQSIAAGLLVTLLFHRWVRGGVGILLLLACCVSILNISHQVSTPDFALAAGLLAYLREGFQALLINGAFPVLPWIGFIALGVIWQSATERLRRWLLRLAVMVLAMPFFLPVEKYPLSPGYLLFFSGLCILLASSIGLVVPWINRYWDIGILQKGATLLSRYSLEIFVIHYALGHMASVYLPTLKLPIFYSVLPGFGLLMLSLMVLAGWTRFRESLIAMG